MTGGIATQPLTTGAGTQIEQICSENNWIFAGFLYLAGGQSPVGMHGVLNAGAWQLVANGPVAGKLRPRVITPIDEGLVPADLRNQAKNLNAPTYFTGS